MNECVKVVSSVSLCCTVTKDCRNFSYCCPVSKKSDISSFNFKRNQKLVLHVVAVRVFGNFRNIGIGACAMSARVGGIAAPQIVRLVNKFE